MIVPFKMAARAGSLEMNLKRLPVTTSAGRVIFPTVDNR